MKQLTIDDAAAEKSTDILPDGLPVHQGIPIPNDMPLPGQDGYRTPNIQDYERHVAATHPTLHRHSQEPSGSKSNTPLRTPPISSAILNKQSPNLNNLNLALEALHWRERIRHFTWTFFTMTMATGGIANVLYTEQMTPIWIFPAYPLLIVGPHASILCKSLPPDQALDIIIGGFTVQGIGFLVAFMIYASFIYRLMTQKLPQASSRPGMFVSVGPSGFTVAGVVGMAESLAKNLPDNFMGDGHLAAIILRIIANWACLWIWGLACWFFLVSVGAHWSCAKHDGSIGFNMTWFSFVFPNTALITATFAIGKAFNSKAIQVIGCIMTVLLIVAWFLVFGMMIRAIKNKRILWPQKGEDKDEGGFKAPARREKRGTLEKLASGVSHGESN
ncbi:MAG: hypothetical protein Q9167_000634 [Letrouitia subvulpina]